MANDQGFPCGCGVEFGSHGELEAHRRKAHPGNAHKNPGTSPKQRKAADL